MWKPTAQRDERCTCPPSEFDRAMAEAAMRLYAEHRDTEIHTGDVYVEGCPTCFPDAP
jgi:hypothetical protein